jgi:hypothetical protein
MVIIEPYILFYFLNLIAMKKLFTLFLFFAAFQNYLFACHGTGVLLNSVTAVGDGTYNISVNVCFGTTANWAATTNFSIAVPGVTVNSILSGANPSYNYVTAGSLSCGNGPNTKYPAYNVNASATASISGSSVSYTNTSTWGTYAGYYYSGSACCAGSPTVASNPCSGTPPGTPPFVQDDAYYESCTGCSNSYGASGTNSTATAIETFCFTLVVNVSAYPTYVIAQSGFEGSETNNCNAVASGGSYTSNDTQPFCQNTSGTCDPLGTGNTNGTAVIEVASALPIYFKSFNVNSVKNENVLTWVTSIEENTDFFEIEKSLDGVYFTAIDKVGSKGLNGNSIQDLKYSYIDKNQTAKAYYRIKCLDKAKNVYTTKILAVTNGSTQKIINVAPNPIANGQVAFSINSEYPELMLVEIYNVEGKRMKSINLTTTEGLNYYTIDLPASNITKGLYNMIFVNVKNGQSNSVRFLY